MLQDGMQIPIFEDYTNAWNACACSHGNDSKCPRPEGEEVTSIGGLFAEGGWMSAINDLVGEFFPGVDADDLYDEA
jgi:hypothetical protein